MIRGVAWAITGCGLPLLASCALLPSLGPRIEEFRLESSLRSREAACIVAEALAYEFTSANRDPLRPRACAIDLGNGEFRVEYDRRARGGFEPSSNGFFARHRGALDQGDVEPIALPESILRGVSFYRTQSYAARAGATDRVRVDIVPSEGGSIVTLASWGSSMDWAKDRHHRLVELLEMCQQFANALHAARVGRTSTAIAQLATLYEAHASGFSAIHDPLLAEALVLHARLLASEGDPYAARRSVRHARLLAPSSAGVALLEAKLNQRLAQPDRSLQALTEATNLSAPGSSQARALEFSARRAKRLAEESKDPRLAQRLAQRALAAGDFESARAWANHALSHPKENASALTLLADALDGLGKGQGACDVRLQAREAGVADAEALSKLAAFAGTSGMPALGLRTLLRHAKELPALLAAPQAAQLARRLGWKRTLRMLRTEHLDTLGLPLALAQLKRASDDNDAFVAALLATDAFRAAGDQETAPTARPTERGPNTTFGTSGVSTTPVASPPR